MTQQKRFYRKLVYVGIMIALLLVLNWMGHPSYLKSGPGASANPEERTFVPGGELAQLRDQYNLSETKLGEIDPASSTMKLATFGMRGVAIALLWHRSLECEKRADWENVKTIGEQITSLEPHFITIWDFVGWKLAYNASAQYDDYRERYRWVINGFDFLQNGTVYNKLSAKLYKSTGWTISQKIGIADEKSQYRRLFREDHDFHQQEKDRYWDSFWSRYQREFTYDARPDNWLFGRVFYLAAEELFEDPANNGSDLGKETRAVFYCRSRMNLINYARWMEIDGCGVTKDNTPLFDETNAAGAWRNAEKYWKEFCQKKMVTVIEDRQNKGHFRETYLNEYLDNLKEREDLLAELASMLPEGMTPESIVWDRFNNVLDDKQRGALYYSILYPEPEANLVTGPKDKPIRIVRDYLDGKYGPQPGWEDWEERLKGLYNNLFPAELQDALSRPEFLRSREEMNQMAEEKANIFQWSEQGKSLLAVTGEILAEKIEGDARLKAQDICDRLNQLKSRAVFANMYRELLDCNKHDRDVVVEQLPEARMARQLRYQARVKFYAGEHEEANQDFLGSMAQWNAVMEKPEFPEIRHMSQYTSEFLDEVDKYTIILDQLESIFPADYPFRSIVEAEEATNERNIREALEWVRQRREAGDWTTVNDATGSLTRFWDVYFDVNEVNPFFPSKISRECFPQVLAWFVESCEKLGEEKIAEAKERGFLDNYPLKPHLELLIAKGEPLYEEIQKNEIAALTDADKESEYLRERIGLWEELLKKYPILAYDSTSEFRSQIQRDALSYLEDLKAAGEEKPENFPLEPFLKD